MCFRSCTISSFCNEFSVSSKRNMRYPKKSVVFSFVGTGQNACVLVGSFLLPARAAGSAQTGLLQAARAGPRRKYRAVRLPNWNHIQRQRPCASITFNLPSFLEICQEILGLHWKFRCWLYSWNEEWNWINELSVRKLVQRRNKQGLRT